MFTLQVSFFLFAAAYSSELIRAYEERALSQSPEQTAEELQTAENLQTAEEVQNAEEVPTVEEEQSRGG